MHGRHQKKAPKLFLIRGAAVLVLSLIHISKDIKTTRLVFKNVEDKLHYKGALAVQVENGKSRLVKKGDLNTFYKLDFKGEPLMQVYDFWEDDRSHIAPA